MPAVLTATAEPLNSPPRVRLDVTLPAGSVGVSAYVTRVGPDGRTVPVRLADPALVTGSAWVGFDYEAPYAALCTYSASVVYYAAGGARANLCVDPSFEATTLTRWGAGTSGAIVRDSAQAWVGPTSGRMDTTAADVALAVSGRITAPSTAYTFSAYVRGTGSVQLELIDYYSYATLGLSSVVALTGAWQRVDVTVFTPAETVASKPNIWQRAAGANSLWIDGVLWEAAASVGAYFDGDTPDGALIHAWADQPHNSTSTETTTTPLTETPTDTALVDVADVWLVHPGIPDLSMPLAKVKSLGDRSRQVARGVFEPYGRAMPIVVTDGKRKAPQAQLVIRTRTLAELAALQALTADAATLLLNVPDALGWGQGAEYIALGDLTESREVDIGADAARIVSGPYLVTSRPIGGSQSQRTYADLLTEASTYQWLLDLHDTYLDMLAPTT